MTENHTDHADVKIHPPVLLVLHLGAVYLLGRLVPLPFSVPPLIENIGFVCVVIGFLFGLGAIIEVRRANTTVDPHGDVSTIVTSGISRYTRNPIYLGFLLMLIGIPLNGRNIWGIVLAPVFVFLMNRLAIEKEESYLEKKFGEVYSSYKSRVRRWL